MVVRQTISIFEFKWDIKQFTSLGSGPYESETFFTTEKHAWRIKVFPYGRKPVSLKSPDALFLIESLAIDARGLFYWSRKDTRIRVHLFCGTTVLENPWVQGPQPHMTKVYVYNRERFQVLGGPHSKSKSSIQTLRIPSLVSALLADFGNPVLSDVVFRFFDGKTLYARKSILSSSCEHFCALFTNGTQESARAPHVMVVDVPDVRPELFRAFAIFLYTGSLRPMATDVITPTELYCVADKYEVASLCRAMEQCIIDGLMPRTVVGLLFDQAYLFPVLKQSCLDFIGKHFVDMQDREPL